MKFLLEILKILSKAFSKKSVVPAQPVPMIKRYTPNGLPVYERWQDFPWERHRWPNFSAKEFACKGTGRVALSPVALDALQSLRTHIGKPIRITSGYRSPEHNTAVGGTPNSKHMQGIAFDIPVPRPEQEEFIQAAQKFGFNGIGQYPNFVHIDTRNVPTRW